MRKLPFLNGVRAFEAVARTGSIAGAARELAVSPAAVSRMVKLLEERLGLQLFQRRANRLQPTPIGETYAAGLGGVFDEMAALTDRVRAEGGRRVLTVGVGPTFAVRWLIPRLAAFREEAPDIEVRITTGGATVPFSPDWTCGIVLEDRPPPGLVADPLFAADLLPVCAPALAGSLCAPQDLSGSTLIRVTHAADDWPTWFAAAGVAGIEASGPAFEFYGQAIQAAADGVGVALGIRPYIDDDLAAGRLVAPFDVAVPKGRHWDLVHRPDREADPSFQVFRDWIRRAAGRNGGG